MVKKILLIPIIIFYLLQEYYLSFPNKDFCLVSNCKICKENNTFKCHICSNGFIRQLDGQCRSDEQYNICKVDNCFKCIANSNNKCLICITDFDLEYTGSCQKHIEEEKDTLYNKLSNTNDESSNITSFEDQSFFTIVIIVFIVSFFIGVGYTIYRCIGNAIEERNRQGVIRNIVPVYEPPQIEPRSRHAPGPLVPNQPISSDSIQNNNSNILAPDIPIDPLLQSNNLNIRDNVKNIYVNPNINSEVNPENFNKSQNTIKDVEPAICAEAQGRESEIVKDND